VGLSVSGLKQRLAAIMAADVAGYSRLMAADECATAAALDAARTVFRRHIDSNQGRVINLAGNSVLASFELAASAVTAALGVQRELNATSNDAPEDRRMRFRIGVHLGGVIQDTDGTVYGDGVTIAARLEGLAEPGGITVSDEVRVELRGEVEAGFEDQGELLVKNIVAPVRAYRVKVDGHTVNPASEFVEVNLPLPEKPSIAVLPFINMSGDAEQEFFTDGITEDIITDLSRFHSLFVIARNSSFSYKGKPSDVRQVGRELGVSYVLEGSIRRAGNRIRITAQLIDSLTGRHIWAERYDREAVEIFAVQDEVTRSIVRTIAPEIESAEIARVRRRRPKSLTAYEHAIRAWASERDAYLTANHVLLEQAIHEAKEAIAVDPSSTLALNALALAQWTQVLFRWAPDLEAAWRKGMDAAERAIELDPSDSLGHVLKGHFLAHVPGDEGGASRYDEALIELRRAHDLNPNDPFALRVLGLCEAISGDPMRGIAHLQQGLRNNPRDPTSVNPVALLSLACFLAEDYASGAQWGLRAVREAPNLANAHMFLALNYVGLADFERARAALETARRLAPEFVQARIDGFSVYRKPDDRQRQVVFMRIAAGLDDPSVARELLSRRRGPALSDAVAARALQGGPLTEREAEILRLIAKGLNFAEVGGVLDISSHTVVAHLKKMYRKLSVHSRGEAVFEASRLGLL
jgi:adenylate cyclase